jgi:hypothetical protein
MAKRRLAAFQATKLLGHSDIGSGETENKESKTKSESNRNSKNKVKLKIKVKDFDSTNHRMVLNP